MYMCTVMEEMRGSDGVDGRNIMGSFFFGSYGSVNMGIALFSADLDIGM